MRPLAIDLFCGLAQPELGLCAYSTVQQLVACRAQHPNHVRFGVFHFTKCAVAAMFGAVGELNDSVFTARLAGGRKIGVFPSDADDDAGVLESSTAVVDLPYLRILTMKGSSRLLGRLPGAVVRAVAAIAVRGNDLEVRPADSAVTAGLCDVGLFIAPKSSGARLASDRTVSFVGPFRMEASAA